MTAPRVLGGMWGGAGEAVRVECGGVWEAGWREQEALGTGRVLAMPLNLASGSVVLLQVLGACRAQSAVWGAGSRLRAPNPTVPHTMPPQVDRQP